MPSCNTAGFPSCIDSYDKALEHFRSVEPWRSKYNPYDERPIGIRAVKHNDDYKFNKAMGMLGDEAIYFRLFDTNCVVWHRDNTVTVEGWPSISTSSFIHCLTPRGVSHSYRETVHGYGPGGREREDPVLHLMQVREQGDSYRWTGPVWSGAKVIRCSSPVRLHYSTADDRWMPVDLNDLEPFRVCRVNRKDAREASRRYNLPTLEKVVNAAVALADIPPPPPSWTGGGVPMVEIMDHLLVEEYAQAIALMPRGTKRVFGKERGTASGIEPGFLTRLRNFIYDYEGVVGWVEQTILSSTQYARYIADLKRFT